jgi:hypothetical protein
LRSSDRHRFPDRRDRYQCQSIVDLPDGRHHPSARIPMAYDTWSSLAFRPHRPDVSTFKKGGPESSCSV